MREKEKYVKKPGTVTGTMQRYVAGASDIRAPHKTPGFQRHHCKMLYSTYFVRMPITNKPVVVRVQDGKKLTPVAMMH
jgi:hypothetical protein